MPRTARIVIENGNACYHILTRGNQKQIIFFQEADYEKYLQLLIHYKIKFNLKIYGYCLMPNHVHLLIEPQIPKEISKAIGGLNLAYTIWFNKKYGKVGHLWQDRFKSFIVERDQYLINCINYIELNPVRAEIVQNPFEYRWNSYKTRLSGKGKGKVVLLDELEL